MAFIAIKVVYNHSTSLVRMQLAVELNWCKFNILLQNILKLLEYKGNVVHMCTTSKKFLCNYSCVGKKCSTAFFLPKSTLVYWTMFSVCFCVKMNKGPTCVYIINNKSTQRQRLGFVNMKKETQFL